jgi:hypothetical protein
MIVCFVVVGGGKRLFPDGVRPDLELFEERRFRKGAVKSTSQLRRITQQESCGPQSHVTRWNVAA